MEYFHSESLIKSVFYRKSLKKDKLFKEELMRYTTIKEFMLSDFARASKFCFGFPGNIQQFEQWAVLAERYDVWRIRTQPLESIYRVPKKLHQIWIGGPLPAEYDLWTRSWREHNPGWEYKLWTERDILSFGLRNEKAFCASPSYGVKSDIARYEILERLGGVYVDTDLECLRPINYIVDRCSFFAGTVFGGAPQITNSIIGSTPNHSFVSRLVKKTNQPVFTRDGMAILEATGPILMTRLFFESIAEYDISNVILPSNYFYPLPSFARLEKNIENVRSKYVTGDSYGIHYWEVSWCGPVGIRKVLSRAKRFLMKYAFIPGSRNLNL